MGRHELRFWDGARWTEHVSTAGEARIDHLDGTRPVSINISPEKIQRQVELTAPAVQAAPPWASPPAAAVGRSSASPSSS